MANKKQKFVQNDGFHRKRGRPRKDATPLNRELSDEYPDEKDRTYYKIRWNQFSSDYPDLNSSSDANILDSIIGQEIRRRKLVKLINDPEHPEHLRDKEINERIEKIDAGVHKLMETLKARRADRDTHGGDDSISIVEFAQRFDLNERQEKNESDRVEELDLLKKKSDKTKIPEVIENSLEEKAVQVVEVKEIKLGEINGESSDIS